MPNVVSRKIPDKVIGIIAWKFYILGRAPARQVLGVDLEKTFGTKGIRRAFDATRSIVIIRLHNSRQFQADGILFEATAV